MSNYLLFADYIIQNVKRNRPFHVVILHKILISFTENVQYQYVCFLDVK